MLNFKNRVLVLKLIVKLTNLFHISREKSNHLRPEKHTANKISEVHIHILAASIV